MPLPPCDFSEFHADVGVRQETLRVSPMAKFVPPLALLQLQALRDSGNNLMLLLDDTCWMLLACLDEMAASNTIMHASPYGLLGNRKLIASYIGAFGSSLLCTAMQAVAAAMAQSAAAAHPAAVPAVPVVWYPYAQGAPAPAPPLPPPASARKLKSKPPVRVGAAPFPRPVSLPGYATPQNSPVPSAESVHSVGTDDTAHSPTAAHSASGPGPTRSVYAEPLRGRDVVNAIRDAIRVGGDAVTVDTFKPYVPQLNSLGPALAAKVVREFMTVDGWHKTPSAVLGRTLRKYLV